MTTDLQQLHNTLDLPERHRGAAEAVCRRSPGRQGREHPPGLQPHLAAVPDVGRGRWPSTWATWPHPAGPSPPCSRPARPSPTFTPPPDGTADGGGGGAPNAAVKRQGRWKHGDMVTRYTRAEAAGEALKWLS